MSEEKKSRVIIAFVVNAVVLVFILLAVLIAQLVHISVLNNRKTELAAYLNSYLETYDTLTDWQKKIESDEEAYAYFLELVNLVGEDNIERYLPKISESENNG